MKPIFFVLFSCFLLACSSSIDTIYDPSCVTASVAELRGFSLEPEFHAGQNFTIFEGYHRCNNLSHGDLVIFNSSAHEGKLIKIIRAVPGDNWSMYGCNVVVNGEVVMTGDLPYCAVDTRRLDAYDRDYPIVPSRLYLVLGNQPDGLDSSRFGFISESQIIGIAIPAQEDTPGR